MNHCELNDAPLVTWPAFRDSLLGCAANCLTCKRAMIPNSVFANNYTDGPTICHSCKQKRNHELEVPWIARESERKAQAKVDFDALYPEGQ